jgi:hypothetical protein
VEPPGAESLNEITVTTGVERERLDASISKVQRELDRTIGSLAATMGPGEIVAGELTNPDETYRRRV